MEFYSVKQKTTLNLSDVENSLYEWKLLNTSTYIKNIIYNENLITFDFELNNIDYHFKIVYNSLKWILELNENINILNITHRELLNMIDKINFVILDSIYPNMILSLIEEHIDKTDFNVLKSTSSSETCNDVDKINEDEINEDEINEDEINEDEINEYDINEDYENLEREAEIENHYGFSLSDANL